MERDWVTIERLGGRRKWGLRNNKTFKGKLTLPDTVRPGISRFGLLLLGFVLCFAQKWMFLRQVMVLDELMRQWSGHRMFS